MASWNNINVLRFGPDFSIFDNSHVNWHTRLRDFSIGYLGALLALSLLYSVALLAAVICKEEVSSFLLGFELNFFPSPY